MSAETADERARDFLDSHGRRYDLEDEEVVFDLLSKAKRACLLRPDRFGDFDTKLAHWIDTFPHLAG